MLKRLLIFILILCWPVNADAEIKGTFAYKMAMMHYRSQHAEEALLNQDLEPPQSIISEFQWIMDTVKHRSLNTETEIADTIVLSWMKIHNIDPEWTLLKTARALSQNARNIPLFGREKVDFRITSQYWLGQQTKK